MAWETLEPSAPHSEKSAKAPIEFGVGSKPGGKGRIAFLTVRPTLLESARFIKAGAEVVVSLGSGEHAGLLRITRGGPFKFSQPGGRPTPNRITLRLHIPVWAGLPDKQRAVVAYRLTADMLEIDLPVWARVAKAETAPSQVETMPDRPAAAPTIKAPSSAPVSTLPPLASQASKMLRKPSEADRPSALGSSLSTRRAAT